MSWADDMDRDQEQHPEQWGMEIDEMGNPVARSEPRCEACARGDTRPHAQHRSEPRAEGLLVTYWRGQLVSRNVDPDILWRDADVLDAIRKLIAEFDAALATEQPKE